MFELIEKITDKKQFSLNDWINYKAEQKKAQESRYREIFGRSFKKFSGVFSMNIQFNCKRYIKLSKYNYDLLNYLQI